MASIATNAREAGHLSALSAGAVKWWWLGLALLFLVSILLAPPAFMGDGPYYTDQIAAIAAHQEPISGLWESGHVLWRPLGYVAMPLFLRIIPESLAWTPSFKIYCGLELLNLVCGLAATILIFHLTRWMAGRSSVAFVCVMLFVWGDAFLDYSQTATPYVTGLTLLLAGIWWLVSGLKSGRNSSLWPALLFGAAALFWLPYVIVIPAACSIPLFLPVEAGGGWTKPAWRQVIGALAISGAVVAAGIFLAGILAGARSVETWRTWLAMASHGEHQNRQAIRAITGCSRLFINLERDGVYFKRFLFHDPYHPMTLAGLFRYSLWKVAFFYVFVASTIILAWRSGAGRRSLALLSIAAVPSLVAALVVFEPSSPERFLPMLPFLLLSIAASWAGARIDLVRRLALAGVVAFAVLLPVINLPSFLWGGNRFHQRAAAQLRRLQGQAAHEDAIFTVTMAEPLEELALRPFDPLNRNGAIRTVYLIDPMNADLAHWRNHFARYVEAEWGNRHSVWLEKYALNDRPAEDLAWTEGDNPSIRWKDIPAFFRSLAFDRETSGEDGFLRLSDGAQNQMLLRNLSEPRSAQ